MIDSLLRRRRALHRIPELKFDLPRTKTYLLNELARTGAKIEPVLDSGLAVFFDAGKPDTVAFRSDMDALSIEEATGAPYASAHAGAMHACGHDGHMAMLLALADSLSRSIGQLPHNVLLIFQPAEESGGGANFIVQTGLLERFNVRRIFALHVDPDLPIGTIGSRPGPLMASSTEVILTVHGKSAHAAMADEGIDALAAAADYITRLRRMEQAMPPEIPRLLKFGSFHSGSAPNIIANRVDIEGTMRTYSDEVFDQMLAALRSIAGDVEKEYKATIEMKLNVGYPALINDYGLFEATKTCLESVSGISFVTLPVPSLLAEDFSFYLQRVPGMMLKLGLGTGIALHSNTFDFDEKALITGAEALIALSQMS